MANKRLAGTRVLMVVAPTEFRDEELMDPMRILSEQGAEVVVASTRPGEATGMLGAKVSPSKTLDAVKASDYSAIVVVGGMGSPTHLWDNAHLHQLLRDTQAAGKVVAGICLSGAVLAKSGVLKGKRATVWETPESVAALQNGGAHHVKDHVVSDGNVVTADGPQAAADFGNRLVEVLSSVASRM